MVKNFSGCGGSGAGVGGVNSRCGTGKADGLDGDVTGLGAWRAIEGGMSRSFNMSPLSNDALAKGDEFAVRYFGVGSWIFGVIVYGNGICSASSSFEWGRLSRTVGIRLCSSSASRTASSTKLKTASSSEKRTSIFVGWTFTSKVSAGKARLSAYIGNFPEGSMVFIADSMAFVSRRLWI